MLPAAQHPSTADCRSDIRADSYQSRTVRRFDVLPSFLSCVRPLTTLTIPALLSFGYWYISAPFGHAFILGFLGCIPQSAISPVGVQGLFEIVLFFASFTHNQNKEKSAEFSSSGDDTIGSLEGSYGKKPYGPSGYLEAVAQSRLVSSFS